MKKISINICLFAIFLIFLISCRQDENIETENIMHNNFSEKNAKKISAQLLNDYSNEINNKIDSLDSEAESLETTPPNEEQDPKGIPPKK